MQKRVSLYLSKIDQAANKLDLQNSKRTLDVNVGAANRFISSAIPELSSEQRQKLKEVLATRTDPTGHRPLPQLQSLAQLVLPLWHQPIA